VLAEEGSQCDCGEVQQQHDKCVQDYWNLDEQRKAFETESVATCDGKLEELRGESQRLQIQVEEANGETNRVRDIAKSEFDQFQGMKQDLEARLEQAGSSQRNLEASKTKLERNEQAAKKEVKEARTELKHLFDKVAEMEAAKTIITIDYALLQQRLEEIKKIIMTYVNQGLDFLQERFSFVQEKVMEFWVYLQTEVFPEIVKFVETDAIPFVTKSWKQAKDAWEGFYAPHRAPVNKQIAETKAAASKAYQEHLEPHVKEHKLDQHLADAKAKVEMYRVLAHSELVNAIDSGTGVALNFVKLEEGPDFIIENLTKLHQDPEKVAHYIEIGVSVIFAYMVLKFLFGPRKKAKKPKKSKKEWEAEQKKMSSPKNGQGTGNKNGKKKSCNWVANKPTKWRCKRIGDDGTSANDSCPAACNEECA